MDRKYTAGVGSAHRSRGRRHHHRRSSRTDRLSETEAIALKLRQTSIGHHSLCMEERERRKAIDQTLVQLEKQFGKGSILRLGSSNVVPVSVISTGSISIDAAP